MARIDPGVLAEYARLGIMPISGGDGTDDADPGDDADGDDHTDQDDADDNEDDAEDEPTFKPIKSQADFDRMIKDRVDRATKTGEAKAKQAAASAAAKRQGNFEKLYNDEIAKTKDLESQIQKRDLDSTRQAVARKHSLPVDVADRIKGDTEAEMIEDAKKLAKFLGKTKAAGSSADDDTEDDDEGTDRNDDAGKRSKGAKGKGGSKAPTFRFSSPTKTVKVPV